MPLAADSCPQCRADVRLSGARCKSCGFWLPAAPAPRTGPPAARPPRPQAAGRRALALVLSVGGVLVGVLALLGAFVWLRPAPAPVLAVAAPSGVPLVAASAVPAALDPNALLPKARQLASAWHADAVLVAISAEPLDQHGVAPGGSVELTYARPNGRKIIAGAETSAERLLVRGSGAEPTTDQQRGARARAVPEPNCLFDDALRAARRAGSSAASSVARLRYAWSEKHQRPVWEAAGAQGDVLRTLDGVSCSILIR